MMSKQTTVAITLALASGVIAFPCAASGQIASASPSALATANNYTALARGYTAIALNPAGLAMPGNPGFSLTLLPLQAKAGLSAMTLGEIASYDDQRIPTAVRERWLQSVVEDDGLELRSGVSASGLALSAGPIGLQVSTVGEARANLSPDAFELLMFGNAGLTGTPRDMSLAGTGGNSWAATTVALAVGTPRDMSLAGTGGNSWAATTVALAVGIPLPSIQNGSFAMGASLKYTIGHIAGVARDVGSVVESNPFGVDLEVSSMLPSDFDFDNLKNNGTGIGMDLGLAWEGSTWVLSAAVQNIFHTFQWDLAGYTFGVTDVVLDGTSFTANYTEVPATGTTSLLITELLDQRFEPVINMGVAYRQSEKLALTADFRHDTGEALVVGERSNIGMGVEFLAMPFLPLRAGVSRVSGGGLQLGAGLGLAMGPVHLSGAYLTEKNSAGEFRAASVALSFAHN